MAGRGLQNAHLHDLRTAIIPQRDWRGGCAFCDLLLALLQDVLQQALLGGQTQQAEEVRKSRDARPGAGWLHKPGDPHAGGDG